MRHLVLNNAESFNTYCVPTVYLLWCLASSPGVSYTCSALREAFTAVISALLRKKFE